MKAKVNGIEINYEITGKEGAPWLVLSHSLACSVRMWDPTVAAFKDSHRILNYDMRGHGHTSAPAAPYSLDMLADDILGLTKELKIEKASYCGLSIGGMIGQTIALRGNHPFQRMVFADTTHTQPPEALKQWEDRIRIAESKGMAGLLDSTMERWFTKFIGENVPGAKFVGIPQASHIANVEQPEAFNRALRDFLSSPASARA
jgi:3-oxoadipate enol-lactonase